MSDAYAIIGMQYGSEAKGALAGYLGIANQPDVCVSNWSPNAGHTWRKGDIKLVRRCLPIGAYTSDHCKYALLGPGSIIDPQVLSEEVADLRPGTIVVIHPFAAVVLPEHLERESDFTRIGSTQKGAGAAAMDRMKRKVEGANIALDHIRTTDQVVVDENLYHQVLGAGPIIQIEP